MRIHQTHRKAPPATRQDPARETVTQSISFDWEVYEMMERARFEARLPIPRSAFVRMALEEKFIREGRMKTNRWKKAS